MGTLLSRLFFEVGTLDVVVQMWGWRAHLVKGSQMGHQLGFSLRDSALHVLVFPK